MVSSLYSKPFERRLVIFIGQVHNGIQLPLDVNQDLPQLDIRPSKLAIVSAMLLSSTLDSFQSAFGTVVKGSQEFALFVVSNNQSHELGTNQAFWYHWMAAQNLVRVRQFIEDTQRTRDCFGIIRVRERHIHHRT
jgi:hypothetical protein